VFAKLTPQPKNQTGGADAQEVCHYRDTQSSQQMKHQAVVKLVA